MKWKFIKDFGVFDNLPAGTPILFHDKYNVWTLIKENNGWYLDNALDKGPMSKDFLGKFVQYMIPRIPQDQLSPFAK